MDVLAFEVQFLDHLAPVWRVLDPSIRGKCIVESNLVDHARALGIEAEGVRGNTIRLGAIPPKAVIEDGPQAIVASYGDMKVGRRLGYRRFAFLEHGIGQSYAGHGGPGSRHGSYAGGTDREDVELFLLPNDRCAERWRAAYPDADIRVIGSPHLDALPAREPGPAPVVALAFHWNASHIASEAGTVFGHYRDAFKPLRAAYDVLGHAHPRIMPRMVDHYRRAGIEPVASFDEVCRRADLYVCDNSSTMYEFAATGRPVVVLNGPMYRKHVNHGLRFWEAATVGIQVEQPGDLIDVVALALTDPPDVQADRERALDIVYAYRSGAAERAAVRLAVWGGARVAA